MHGYYAAAVLLLSLGVAYAHVITKLVSDWANNDNYSHGFLVVPLAAYLAWERRGSLVATDPRPSAVGLLVVCAGVAMLAAGTLGAELFISRISLLVVLGGSILFLGGWRHLRVLAFPLAFLLLMIPIPAIIFNQVAFPLQLLASRFGEAALGIVGIPVLREGNLISLANVTLEVAEACSGIRSLISLLTLAVMYGYFSERSWGIRTLLVIATLPVAILANAFRVAAIGIAAHYTGQAAVEGTLHTASGWLVFVVAFAMLLLIHRLVRLCAALWSGIPRRAFSPVA